jgi:hypothetical protein
MSIKQNIYNIRTLLIVVLCRIKTTVRNTKACKAPSADGDCVGQGGKMLGAICWESPVVAHNRH